MSESKRRQAQQQRDQESIPTDNRGPEEKLDDPDMSNAQDERSTREAGERDNDDLRPSDEWKPQALLPDPLPQQGWVFRYVRVSTLGANDATNVSRQLREGWIPVNRIDHPEINVPNDIGVTNEEQIQIGGLLLCKMSAEKARQRETYHRKLSGDQMRSVDNSMFGQQDHRTNMSIDKPNRRTSFGSRG